MARRQCRLILSSQERSDAKPDQNTKKAPLGSLFYESKFYRVKFDNRASLAVALESRFQAIDLIGHSVSGLRRNRAVKRPIKAHDPLIKLF